MRFALVLIAAGLAVAETADPISDRMRLDLAVAQRDYLLAQAQMEKATTTLRTRTEALQKACADQGKTFNVETFACAAEKK